MNNFDKFGYNEGSNDCNEEHNRGWNQEKENFEDKRVEQWNNFDFVEISLFCWKLEQGDVEGGGGPVHLLLLHLAHPLPSVGQARCRVLHWSEGPLWGSVHRQTSPARLFYCVTAAAFPFRTKTNRRGSRAGSQHSATTIAPVFVRK